MKTDAHGRTDVRACATRGVLLCNTPDVLTDTVADLVVGLMLVISRRLLEAHEQVRSGTWPRGWNPVQRFLTAHCSADCGRAG